MKFMSVFSMLNASDAGGFAMAAVLSVLAALCAGGYVLTARRERRPRRPPHDESRKVNDEFLQDLYRRFKPLVAAAAVLAALSGCAMALTYERPAAPIAQQWSVDGQAPRPMPARRPPRWNGATS